MDPQYPAVTAERLETFATYKTALEDELGIKDKPEEAPAEETKPKKTKKDKKKHKDK
jgi:hypothetical protein